MTLIHVGGADPYCKTCNGTGVRGFIGYGMECYCVTACIDKNWILTKGIIGLPKPKRRCSTK